MPNTPTILSLSHSMTRNLNSRLGTMMRTSIMSRFAVIRSRMLKSDPEPILASSWTSGPLESRISTGIITLRSPRTLRIRSRKSSDQALRISTEYPNPRCVRRTNDEIVLAHEGVYNSMFGGLLTTPKVIRGSWSFACFLVSRYSNVCSG